MPRWDVVLYVIVALGLVAAVLIVYNAMQKACPRCWHPPGAHASGTCIKCLAEGTACHWRPRGRRLT